ncbi:SusD/RagB family nutrient-binding outer membrane lipoprotein [Dawidia soli]|uniref:SusD/RagB family nutrient-binding outer membrane lipoprotein n=1 Tax=Dawidia soli TaxID=2782352 RepID=A0AAP2D6A5_9BACT|nr:SusD/RagB family nutrient-binding outer membrane lipoprotein [Dawidia soli]MBT1685892.1 SusD/RagB family nutrient-binding outer membrane lipoprotein [Dawidia soli]
MKKTKRYILRATCMLLGSCMLLLACTESYESINTDKRNVTVMTAAEIPFLFSKALSVAPNNQNNYQIAQNLFADQYAQYFACTASSFGSDRLVINQNWVGAAFNPIYTQVAPQLDAIFQLTDPSTAEYQLASIWWVYAFHRVTDYWGPIPYTQILQDSDVVPYDAQDAIYNNFFERLSAAVTVLEGKRAETPFGNYDILYGGDVDRWIKFANTLRLRLAMRISNVNPERAQTEAEAAVAGGVMEESPTDDALVQRSLNGGDGNGLAIMQWNEFRMSASMESVLKGYEDPRITEYYLPHPVVIDGTEVRREYDGARNGMTPGQMAAAVNHTDSLSQQGPRWSPVSVGGIATYNSTPQNVMCSAEAWFLRAEGALKNWNMGGGTSQEYYEAGITQSFLQWGFTADQAAAYAASTNTPVEPDDFFDSPAMTDIPVAFGSTLEVQEEQIATQKWIALFPDGVEAWADYRRSHKLKLYPVVNSDNPLIGNPSSQWLRRIPFLESERGINPDGVASGEALLNGPDDTQTPLWWDVIPRN